MANESVIEEYVTAKNTEADKDKEEKQEILVIDEDMELQREKVGVFFDKDNFKENPDGIDIKPKGLSKGKYGYNLAFNIVGDTVDYLIDLNKTNYNWFLDNLGTKVSMWKDRVLNMSASKETYERKDRKTGKTELFSGWACTFRVVE